METAGEVAPQRNQLQLLQDQLDGMRAWHAEFAERMKAEPQLASASRETRMDARRRLDALKRTQAALLERADVSIRASRELLARDSGHRLARALVVHRNAWVRHKLGLELVQQGLDVVAELDDGADGLGAAIAEQPDLLIVEDRLPSMSGLEVVDGARRYLARTTIAVHVEDSSGVAAMLEAGASAVFSRRVPPGIIAEQVAEYLRARSQSPLTIT